MSEQTGILDETGRAISRQTRDVTEPLVQHIKDRPISTALIIFAVGFVLGKIL
jgi:ElaB/YqjD/DUF883 family membrane-anchored ribosome-binding protein